MAPLSQNQPQNAMGGANGLANKNNQFAFDEIQESHWTNPPKMQAIKEMPLESYEQLERTYGEDLERICGDHENLIQVILSMEEELI